MSAARRLPASLLSLLALAVFAPAANAGTWRHFDVPAAKAITAAPTPQGPTVAVWLDATDITGIYAATAGPGGALSAPVELAGTWLPDPTLRVDANASGDVLAFWAHDHLVSAFKPHGGAWQAAQDGPATGAGTHFQGALADDGSAYVAWHTGAGVYLAKRAPGGAWSAAQQVNGDADGVDDLALSVGAGASPSVTVAWTQRWPAWNSPKVVQQRTRTGGGSWGTVQQLSAGIDDGGYGAAEHVQLGRAADGTVKAAWVRSSGYGQAKDPVSGALYPWEGPLATIDVAALAPGATQFGGRKALFADTVADHAAVSLAVHHDGAAEVYYNDAYGPAMAGSESGAHSVLGSFSGANPSGAVAPDDTTTVVLADHSNASTWWTGSDYAHAIAPGAPDLVRPDGIHFDRDGDVVVGANDIDSNSIDRLWVYDTAGPQVTLHAPASATTGTPATFSADAADLWATTDVTWDFGDGGSATGTSAAHAFSTSGDHVVTVTATDGAGNATTATAHVAVSATPTDVHGPEIVISSPAAGQHFAQGQRDDASRARWSCTDEQEGDAGVASATGSVADGAYLDTSTTGAHALTVECHDKAGHTATRTQGYFVDAPPAADPGAPGTGSPTVKPPVVTPAVKPPPAQAKATTKASKALPASAPAGKLLGGGLTQRVTAPGNTVLANVLTASAPVITLGGGNVITLGGGNVITAGGGNVITAGGGNVITAGGGNVITAGGGNAVRRAPAHGPAAWAAAAAAKQTVVARGGHVFRKAGTAKLTIKLTAAGRKLLKASGRKHRRGKLTLYALTVTGSVDGTAPAVVAARKLTVRLG